MTKTKVKAKHSVIEQYFAFLKGYEEKKRTKKKTPYEEGSELHLFYLLGQKHKGEINLNSPNKRVCRGSDR